MATETCRACPHRTTSSTGHPTRLNSNDTYCHGDCTPNGSNGERCLSFTDYAASGRHSWPPISLGITRLPLARFDNSDWLLISDNIDHNHEQGGATGAYNLRQYLPGDHGSVLVTKWSSRLAHLGESRQLAKADSVLRRAIQEKWYGGELGSDCDRLLELLDGLSLALEQAAWYLWNKWIGVATYIQIYQQQWDELMGSHGESTRLLLGLAYYNIDTSNIYYFLPS
ncbi:hypothetical protein DER44DRAFT_890804 [Fusarium oxysporum]|nr:hypothetical protein DER44DRAFT_890804 [Fusarium oxysporum]